MPELEDLAHAVRPPAAAAEGAIVLLHGPGATEEDPLALLEVLDPGRRLGGACPRGTLDVPGAIGYRWFVDREPGYPQRDTFEQSLMILEGWLDALWARTGIPAERTIVGGFSQGAVMAWALALSPNRPRPGALVAVSGYIPRVTGFEPDETRLSGMAVAIAHGQRDPRVPVAFAQSARERAEAAGAEVLYRATDVPDILDPRVVPDLIAWVGRCFSQPPRPAAQTQ